MANRITTVFDLDAKGFDTGLKSLRKEVAAADGAINKMKTAGAGLGSILQDNIAQAAMAAGAALVTFGVKSVQAFQDAAIGASRFSTAAGIAVEDASRWMEVSGDLGLSADAVQGAIGRMNKALGANADALKQYGVEVVRAADGTVDANATFIEAVTTIGQIADPTERALAAQKAFGKGYAEIAELMGMSAVELKARLDGVSDAKVIDPAEVAKAKEFRDRMDELKDRLDDVMLTVGEGLVPALSDAAETIGTVADALQTANTAAENLTGTDLAGWASALTKPFGMVGDSVNWFTEKLTGVENVTGRFWAGLKALVGAGDEATGSIDAGTYAADQMAYMYGQRLPVEAKKAADAITTVDRSAQDFTDEIDRAKEATRKLDEAYRSLTGNLDDRAAWRNLQDSLDQTQELIDGGKASWRDLEEQVDDNVAKARDFIKASDDIPDEVKTRLYAQLDQGELDTVLAVIEQLRQGVDVPVRFQGQNQVGFDRSDLDGKQKDPKVKGNSLRMSAKSATVSQPAASAPVLLGGGITRTVSTRSGGGGGGGNADDRRMAAMAEVGDISQDEYKAYLQGRLGEFEKYSDDYMRVWRQINSIDRAQQREADDAAREAQRLADEQARQLAADEAAKQKAADDEIRRTDQIMAAMYEMGAISLQDYQKYLQGRLGAYEQYSAQYMAIWRQLQTLEGGGSGGGNAASADEVRLAELEAQRLQFISDMYGLDPKRTEEEKLKARIDAANAAERLARLRSSMAPAASTTANSSNVTINMPPGSNGQDVVRAIQDYEKRNGKGWRTA